MSGTATQEVRQGASRRGPRAAAAFLFWTALFGLAYTQAPLYYSNQHQYCLHGLARAGFGFLDQDWLANTADPTPVFTAAVAVTGRYLHEAMFHVYFLLLLGLYFHCLAGLYEFVTGRRPEGVARLLFLTLLVAAHAALPRLASAHGLGVDYPWYLQAGVAGQYVLGFGLQPSAFGVLLIASALAFLRGRVWLAGTCAALAAVLHATYLLGAAFLTLAYLFCLWRAGRPRAAVLLGLWTLALVSPAVVYSAITFAPSSAEASADAQRLLARLRIPHHADPARWCDAVALLQVAWVVAAAALARKTPLFWLLAIPFVLSAALTLVQVVADNDTLALLFPWRTSAVLVPMATAVVLARLVGLLAPRLAGPGRRAVAAACVTVLAGLVAGGVAISALGLGYRSDPAELPMLDYVRLHKRSGDVYLLPVQVPKTGPGPRGVVSTSFTPAPRKGGHLIAVDLQRFRLFTGAPVFVDFKSVPYKDTDVLEWHRRLRWAEAVYRRRDWDGSDVLAELRREGITHVVVTADHSVEGDALRQVHEDTVYRVYRVQGPAPGGP